MKQKKVFSLSYFFERLENQISFDTRRMFGCLAIYLHGRNVAVLAESNDDKDWNGVLFPTIRDHHESIQKAFPELQSHPVLGKWLYLPQSSPEFEQTVEKVVTHLLKNDERFGILPQEKKQKKPKPFMNLGPKSKAALKSVGLKSFEQLKKMGWKAITQKVIRKHPEFHNLNFVIAVKGAIEGRDWRSYNSKEKEPVRRWLQTISKSS